MAARQRRRWHYWSYSKKHPGRVFQPIAIVAGPLLVGLVVLVLAGYGYSTLDWLQDIDGNKYQANNVLLLAILVSHLIVAISLWLYFKDTFGTVLHYKGRDDVFVGSLMVRAMRWTGTARVFSVGYVALIVLASFWSAISFRFLIKGNKVVTIICFLIFVCVDKLLADAKGAENAEANEVHAKAGTQPSAAENSRRACNENDIEFSRYSTFLINLPTIIITSLVWWLGWFMENHPTAFGAAFNSVSMTRVVVNSGLDWHLFIDGLETGAIVASLLLSQMIFALIKIRYHVKEHEILHPSEALLYHAP
jgi:hypothetical protein